ncbi:origin recognition complex subunit 4 C-terminus-domain-containing protein [Hygrophoropsis aurantiaca]|uniref:Origin recognition complex subunit 4 C-terminus-domain-containing protein n=1 Tax=Hygrophoropsis aurantiaca TaxID=72124 RepID=A0ACB8AMU1_9AGAM|nr:origin recognition complex subunit 4 C-terminus-domain-containing protein [Hygrophoropsis aurantiaca]
MGKDSPSGKSNPSRPQPSRSRAPGVVSSPASLSKNSPLKPTSPKNNPAPVLPQSPTRLPRVLPAHLIPCLRLQKRAILSAIHDSSIVFNDSVAEEPHTNVLAFEQLRNLLTGTVDRGEGNSCLLLGPRGSGKTQLVEQAIAAIPHRPIILRLSGYAQHNDRLALREIARQLHHQTGKSFLIEDANSEKLDEDDNPFLDTGSSISLPPPSHLPALISLIPTLLRPTIVILDAFDLFASHARQSLLYCLLDTVQSCRVGQSTNGLSVIGVTSRIDAINLLEKRVKSRFSGRMLRVAPPTSLSSWNVIMKRILTTPVDPPYEEWSSLWTTAVDKFQNERVVSDTFQHTFSLTRDVRMLKQILIHVVVGLTASSPFPLPSQLISALAAQRCRIHFPNLHTLSYPSTCLLIAAIHADTAGHDTVNFEMLHDSFRDQFRASASAPVQVEGGSIGMGFEQLLATRMLVPAASSFSNVAPEFIRYRCLVCRQDVKKAVDTIGQTNLKKWLSKAQ